jgi:hypothetical protein
MEPMTAAENLFWQNLEAGAPGIGFSRAEELAHLFFLRAKSHVAAVKVDVPNSLRWEGLIPDAQQLGEWSREGTLAKNIARKPPQHDRAEADLEQDLRKHIVVSEAVLWAFHKGKVHTEKDFLEKDLSGVLPPSVWLNVREARKWYRKTTMIRTLDAAGRMCVIFAYRCDINRASAEDTKAAVRHTQSRAQNTDARSRALALRWSAFCSHCVGARSHCVGASPWRLPRQELAVRACKRKTGLDAVGQNCRLLAPRSVAIALPRRAHTPGSSQWRMSRLRARLHSHTPPSASAD